MSADAANRQAPPPTRHQQALMIWLAVFPTLTVLNLVFGQWLVLLHPVLRTLLLSTVTVLVVVYAIMPQFLRVRDRLHVRRHSRERSSRG